MYHMTTSLPVLCVVMQRLGHIGGYGVTYAYLPFPHSSLVTQRLGALTG